jgi:hypothetical protein
MLANEWSERKRMGSMSREKFGFSETAVRLAPSSQFKAGD